MNIRSLEYFIKVVELNSFTKASEELFISQSAISEQIKALENELGFTLIDRNKKGFTLIDDGSITSLPLIKDNEVLKTKLYAFYKKSFDESLYEKLVALLKEVIK